MPNIAFVWIELSKCKMLLFMFYNRSGTTWTSGSSWRTPESKYTSRKSISVRNVLGRFSQSNGLYFGHGREECTVWESPALLSHMPYSKCQLMLSTNMAGNPFLFQYFLAATWLHFFVLFQLLIQVESLTKQGIIAWFI